MFKKLFIILILLFSVSAFAQNNLDINGQIRHRFELNKKTFVSSTNPYGVNYLRTRVGIKFVKDSLYGAFVQIQDSRIWGEEFLAQ